MNICSREEVYNQKNEIKVKFPDLKEPVCDLHYLDGEHRHVLVAVGLERRVPLFRELFTYQNVAYLLSSLKENSVLDVAKGTLNGKEFPFINELKEAKERCYDYGGMLDRDGNHIIPWNSPKVGTHFAVNLLLGDRSNYEHPLQSTPKSVVDMYGGGSFRSYAGFQVLATTWGISPDENGHPTNRQFYITEEHQPLFYSAMPPKGTEAETIHHPNFTEIKYVTENGLEISRTIFLLPQYKNGPEAVEAQIISIKNLTNENRHLHLVATGMFGCPNPQGQMQDVIYTTVVAQNRAYFNKDGSLKAICPDYYPEYFKREIRFASLFDDQGGADSFATNYAEFLGKGTIYQPDGVYCLDNSLAMKGPNFFALGKVIDLKGKGEEVLYTLTGFANELDTVGEGHLSDFEFKLDNLLKRINSSKAIVNEWKSVIRKEKEYASFLQIKESKDEDFKAYVNHNLPFQVKYQTFVSRSFAMTQKGYREIGFREIQDIYASMPYLLSLGKQNLVKSLLSEWISNVYQMGYANHNFFYVGKEPGMCSDDSLWLIEAIYRYISLTNDYGILNKKFPVAGSKKKRSLRDSIKAILVYSGQISVGRHGLPLLDCADWNDCLKLDPDYLDGPAKEKAYRSQLKKSHQPYGVRFESDLSESVMNAFLFIIAANEAFEIFGAIGDDEYAILAKSLADEMEKNTREHAFINGYYARVLLNRDNVGHIPYVGALKDGLSLDPEIDGSYYLNSFSWSLLSNVATESEIKGMMDVLEKHIRCDAGFKLCTPEDLGRAGAKSASTDHYFPGDRENGGVFKHATMMAVVAMLRASKTVKDEALKERLIENSYFMLDLVLPYKVLENVNLYKGNPRFCTQYNNSMTGENIGPMLSGTATWLTLAIEEAIGAGFTRGGLDTRCALPKESTGLSYTLKLKDGEVKVHIHKEKGMLCSEKTRSCLLDGNEVSGPLSLDSLKGEHELVINY